MLMVEHGQGLHGPENQDLIAPQIRVQQHVAHPSLDRSSAHGQKPGVE
jgi:hypothetical protein